MPTHVLTPNQPYARSEGFKDFLRAHGVDPNETYRVDFELDDEPPAMVVHRYARNDEGAFFMKEGTVNPAVQDPARLELHQPPPKPVA